MTAAPAQQQITRAAPSTVTPSFAASTNFTSSASTAATTTTAPKYNDGYLDILLDALRNVQPGQSLESVTVNTNPKMSLKQLEATCLQMQFV